MWFSSLCAVVGCGAAGAEPRSERPIDEAPRGASEVGPAIAECALEWLHLPQLVRFRRDDASIDAYELEILAEVVTWLQQRSDVRALRIEGHTVRCEVETDAEALSLRRAEAAADALRGMAPDLPPLEVVGYGDRRSRVAMYGCDPDGRRAFHRATELALIVESRVELSIQVAVPSCPSSTASCCQTCPSESGSDAEGSCAPQQGPTGMCVPMCPPLAPSP